MAFFYSSAFSKGKGPSPETIAKRNADLFLKKKAAENYGVINNPKIYEEAIEKYLEPYSDDLTIQQSIAGYQQKAAELSEKQNDEDFKIATINQNLREKQLELGKTFAGKAEGAGNIALQTLALYDDAIRKIRQEAEVNRETGGSYGTLEREVQKLEPTKYALEQLATAVIAGNDEETRKVTGNFGYYIDSDPTTGKIISLQLLPVDDSPKGYLRSDGFYGNVPVYVRGTRNPYNDNELMAKVGGKTFKGSVEEADISDKASGSLKQTVMKLENKNEVDMGGGDAIKNIFRTGQRQKNFDIEKGAYNLDFSDADFIKNSYNEMSNNTIMRDTARNIWLKNGDGELIKFPNLDAAAEALGQPKDLVEKNLKDITNADARSFTNYKTFKDLLSPGQQPANASSSPVSVAPTAPASNQPTARKNSQAALTPAGITDDEGNLPPAVAEAGGAELQKKNTEKITSGSSAKSLLSVFSALNPFRKS